MFKVPEKHRVLVGEFSTSANDGNNGLFLFKKSGMMMACSASDSDGFEKVMVTIHSKGGKKQILRFPTWEEMCMVKALFWKDTDTVIQYHPNIEDNDAFFKNCLYLWRPTGKDIKRPNKQLIEGFYGDAKNQSEKLRFLSKLWRFFWN